jgi:hypothetical protein
MTTGSMLAFPGYPVIYHGLSFMVSVYKKMQIYSISAENLAHPRRHGSSVLHATAREPKLPGVFLTEKYIGVYKNI